MTTQEKFNAMMDEYLQGVEKKSQTQSQKKKKMQFSQKMTLFSAIFSMGIVFVVLIANFILLWNGKEGMPQETITTVSVYGGITSTMSLGGYYVLSGARDCSKNKHAKELKEAGWEE